MGKIPFTVNRRSVSFVTDHYGGIGNRVIPIGCVLSLANELNYRPVIFWMQAPQSGWVRFDDLFDITNLPFELREGYESQIIGKALFRHFTTREIFKKVIFKLIRSQYDKKVRFPPENIRQFMENPASDLLKYRRIMISSFQIFRYACDISWLKPAPQIAHRVIELKKQFAPNTVGVHLRGTDLSICAPIEEYIVRMRAEVELDPKVKFFFASDGDKDGKKIIDLFGDRLIKTTSQAMRKTIQGQQDAIVDLFGLSETSRIIGPTFSTFSMAAAMLSKKPHLKLNSTRFRDRISNR